MEESYETLVYAIDALTKEGYIIDFNLQKDTLELNVNEFQIDKFYRFEGETNPADQVVLYAISSLDGKTKGLFVNAFGVYNESDGIIHKLKVR